MAAPAELIVTGPDGAVTKVKLGDKTIIGRHPECEVVLTDPMSSRRHCKIERTPAGSHIVEDMKSANGTLLNGEPLKAAIATPLKNGDSVQIGSTTMVLRLDVAVRASEGPAVKLDEDDSETALSFVQNAAGPAVSEEELVTTDAAALKRVAEKLKLLVEVGQELAGSLDLPKLLNTCLNKLFEVFPQSDRGLIVLYGPDGSLPTRITPEPEWQNVLTDRKTGIALNRTRGSASAAQMELKLSRTVLGQVRTGHKSVLIEKSGSMSLIDISSVMCAPLLINQNDLGLLYLETRKVHQAFTKDDVGVMTAVAGQIAVVIRNSDLARQAAEQAAHRENLSRFLSPNLVEQMLKGTLNVSLGGKLKKGTIFFSDIVGFTKLAAKMTAEDVVTLLNRYFTVMQNIIFRRGGSIDKCAGDNIMAHYGVVGELPEFTINAVAASVEMQIALFAFNRDEARKAEIVLPPTPLGHGLGLNTGTVCAGNIGSDRKIEFTVIGDAVNLSARIEAMAGRFQTFLGEPTFEEVKGSAFCIRMPDCPAKNVEYPVKVFCARGVIPPPFPEDEAAASPAPAPAQTGRIDDLLFAMPCVLKGPESMAVPGMVTRITTTQQGARIVIQAERPIPVGTALTLEWNIPEKTSMSPVEGEVEKCWQAEPAKAAVDANPGMTAVATPAIAPPPPRGGTAVMVNPMAAGTLLLSAKQLPPDIAGIKPGVLWQTDLKSHEDIVRA